jgi:hypothetical protein
MPLAAANEEYILYDDRGHQHTSAAFKACVKPLCGIFIPVSGNRGAIRLQLPEDESSMASR